MRKLTFTLLGATALVGGLAVAAVAHDRTAGPGAMHGSRLGTGFMQLFERIDGNGDGRVDQAEAETFRTERFTEADADSDGKVTADELAALHSRMVERHAAEQFARLDADGNGEISEQEFVKARLARLQARMSDDRSQEFAARRFARMDANDDGTLDAEELGHRGMRLFEKLDSDQDGVLTREEAQQAMAEHRRHHGKDRDD